MSATYQPRPAVSTTRAVTKVDEGYLIVGNAFKPANAIVVSDAVWKKLVSLRNEIDAAFRDSVVKYWVLEKTSSGEVRASVSVYNNRTYFHVRAWSDGFPTKNGTTVWAWGEFAELLRLAATDDMDSGIDVDEDEDVKLGSETYAAILTESAGAEMKRLCEGCVNDWPSQRDHACITGCPSTVAEAVANVSVTPQYFAVRLAQAAMERDYVLGRVPREVLDAVIEHHDDHLRATLRESLSSDY
jgi:hypothetical protein